MRIRRRRAQSAVEVILLVPVIMMVFISMYYLWSITFAAQNCNLRAREAALHGTKYLGPRANGASGSAPLSGNNYQVADRWPAEFDFNGTSSDTSIPGMGDATVTITANAYITSN